MRKDTSTLGKTYLDWRGVPWIETQYGYVTPLIRRRKPMSAERRIRLLRTTLVAQALGILLVIVLNAV